MSSQTLSTPEAPSLSPGFSAGISSVSLANVSVGKTAVKCQEYYIQLHVDHCH